jgi:hypothetical protein
LNLGSATSDNVRFDSELLWRDKEGRKSAGGKRTNQSASGNPIFFSRDLNRGSLRIGSKVRSQLIARR